jgi:glycosyltransferase involved in cell wall biosynthesis
MSAHATLAPIALLVTAYNRQEKLERMLESVRSEKQLLDIVIVDDGSATALHADRFPDYSIHIIRQDINRGAMAASNIGLEYIMSKGYELIARLDSDDMSRGNRFAQQLAFMKDNPDIGLVGTRFLMVSPEGKPLHTSLRPYDDATIRRFMHIDCCLHHPTFMFRSSVIGECGMYNPAYIAAGDYEFAMRVMQKFKVANLRDILLTYESGGLDSLSTAKRKRQAINAIKIRLKYFDPLSFYSYAGLLYGLLDIANLLKYMHKIKSRLVHFS